MSRRRYLVLALALALGLAIFLRTASYALRPDDEGVRTRLEDFYAQPKDTLDVVFVGSSAAYAFFSPMRLYADTGLTAAMIATPNQTVDMLPAILEEGRRTQPNALYVIELRPMLASSEDNARLAADLRRLTDNMPYSLNRLRCIEALAPEGERLSWHIDLAKYHDRWPEVKLSDLRLKWGRPDDNRGFAFDSNVEPVLRRDWRSVNATIDPEPENVGALEALLHYIQTRDMDVVFVATPFALSREQAKKYNAVSALLEARGFEFLNMNRRLDDIGLDFGTDYSDFRHVNILGAVKCTDWIAEALAARRTPAGRQDDAAWRAALAVYRQNESNAIARAKEAAMIGE